MKFQYYLSEADKQLGREEQMDVYLLRGCDDFEVQVCPKE